MRGGAENFNFIAGGGCMAKSKAVYNCIVVGSGAAGGWAAKELTAKGMTVLVLEAGPPLDPSRHFNEHTWPYELPHHGYRTQEQRRIQPVQSECYACSEYTSHLFVNDLENPYTTPAGKPFKWIRGRHVGGKTIMWARQSYRFSDYDFKAASHDGYGQDWPLRHDDLAPYYEKVERFVGISGEALNLPQLPDSAFLPPMNLTCGEQMMKKAAKKSGKVLTIGRAAVLTRAHMGRAPCHFCGYCRRGCHSGSYFSSPISTLPAAAATGRMTLQPNAVVRHLLVDEDRMKVKGVYYIDRLTRQPQEVYAESVVLGASALESTRILLNTVSHRFPHGLGNSSGALGHYLMDHLYGVGVRGHFPRLRSAPVTPDDGRPNGIYIPRSQNLATRHPKFIRGYGFQGGSGRGRFPQHAQEVRGFGAGFKRAVREDYPMPVRLSGFGEMLPRYENYVEIDPNQVDAWGVPVLHIRCRQADNERAMVDDMIDNAAQILTEAGAEITGIDRSPGDPGLGIHECGTCRMGADPKTSVLNGFNQSHDVKNLFVVDGSSFVTQACVNPTLTIMALTARACEYLVEEYRRGNL